MQWGSTVTGKRRLGVALALVLGIGMVGLGLFGGVGRDRHTQLGGLSFDHPGDWTVTAADVPLHYETVLGFLTSPGASARESCGPDYVPGGGGDCAETSTVPTGSAVLRLSRWDGPPVIKGPIADLVDAGWQSMTIAGQPAAYMDHSGRMAGHNVEWRIAAGGADSLASYGIVATINGPPAGLRAQIDAMLGTLKIAPQGP